MPVQQDQLSPANTSVTFETINNDRIDRLFHNGTDILKCRLQYFEVTEAARIFVTNPATLNPREYDVARYLTDGLYTSPSTNALTYVYRIKCSRPIVINKVKLYSSQEIISASLNAITLATNSASITVTSRVTTFRNDLSPAQYEHTLNFANTSLQEIRISLATPVEAYNTISEIIVGDSYPKSNVVYYGTDGVQKSSFTAEQAQLIDMCYNPANGRYYSVRYRNITSDLFNPDDNFSTPSGSSSFDSIRWTEDFIDSSFFRSISNNNLVFSTTSGVGSLTSNADYTGSSFQWQVDFNAVTLTGSSSFFGLHAVDQVNQNLIYGVGVTSRGGSNFYKAAVKSYSNNTGGSFDLRRLRATLRTVQSGAETWTVTYTGASGANKLFSVVGSINGSQPSITATGYITTYLNSHINFEILATENVAINNNINFIVDYETDTRASASGTINLQKSASNFYTSSNSALFDETLTSNPVKSQLFATTTGAMNITADNFDKTSGDHSYSNYPVLTVERINNQAQVTNNIISGLDVLASNGVTAYNQIPFGAVQFAVNGADDVYLKVFDKIYTFSGSTNLTGVLTPPGSGVTTTSAGIVPSFGISSFHFSEESGGFLGYIEFDDFLGEIRLKTLNDTNPPTVQTRQAFLEVPDYNEVKTSDGVPYQFYTLANDGTSLFYLRKNGNAGLNSVKTTGTAGAVVSASQSFTDVTKNFNTLNVKKGDLCTVSTASNAGTYIVTAIPNNTVLNLAGPVISGNLINTPLTPRTSWTTAPSLTYSISSNAELLQFNLDPNITAFTSVNIDNYNLQAGTGEIGNITAEVINSWGEVLAGKSVNFQVIQGDSVVAPPTATTNASGVATTALTVGNTAGAIQVQVTVSD